MKLPKIFPQQFGWIPYIFLAYLILPLIVVLSEEGVKRIIGIALLLTFLVIYRQAYWAESDFNHLVWSSVQMIVILLLAIYYEPYNLLLAFFVSNFIGWIRNSRLFTIAMLGYGAMLAFSLYIFIAKFGAAANLTLFPFVAVMALVPIAVRNNILRSELVEQLDEANERIRKLSRQEERIRIARDLHDTLGHTLSLITLQSQVVQRVKHSPERVGKEAKEIEETSRTALKQVRELVSDMQNRTIESELVDMEILLSTANIEFLLDKQERFSELSSLKQNIIAMCLREVATNIVRHSKASFCQVKLFRADSGLAIKIQDNGKGMSQSDWGNGITGMRDRLTLIDGELVVRSDKGTLYSLFIPLPVTREGEETV